MEMYEEWHHGGLAYCVVPQFSHITLFEYQWNYWECICDTLGENYIEFGTLGIKLKQGKGAG